MPHKSGRNTNKGGLKITVKIAKDRKKPTKRKLKR